MPGYRRKRRRIPRVCEEEVAVEKKIKTRRLSKTECEEEKLRKLLIEGYKARNEEGTELNAEMEFATLEDWPEY
jgi:hypothetical protein